MNDTNKKLNALEERMVNHLIIHSFDENRLGLLDGRMGIAIAFYWLGRNCGNAIYTNWGNQLLDSILENLTPALPKDFATGLCGIVWGIKYLLHTGFVTTDSNDIFEELDKLIIGIDTGKTYPFNLAELINPNYTPHEVMSRNALSLRDGLSGYLIQSMNLLQ